MPMTSTGSLMACSFSRSLDLQFEKVRGAGDTGIIIADRLLTLPGELVLRQVEMLLDIVTQIILDGFLVLRRRGDNPGLANDPLVVKHVAVVEDTARSLRAGAAGRSARLHLDKRALRLLILLDQAQRFVESIENLNTADNDTLKWVVAGRTQPGKARGLLSQGGEPIKVQIIAGQRPGQIRATRFEPGVQGIRIGNMLFNEMVF